MIDKQHIRDFLIKITNNNSIGDEDSLVHAKLLDSLNIAELVTFLEEQYQFTFDADEIIPENLDTINAIASFIATKEKP